MANKSKVVVKWIKSGYLELMKSPEIQQEVMAQAQNYLSRLGDGYDSEDVAYIGQTRASVRVGPVTEAAINDNYDNNTMLVALGGRK